MGITTTLILLAAPLGAVGTIGTEGMDPAELDRVVVIASRFAQPAGRVVGSASGTAREDLQRELASDLAEAVRYDAGVTVLSDPTRFGLTGFAVRGLDGNRVGMELDGIPVQEGFAVGSFSNATRGGIDVDLLSGIEILRGPASTLYGSDALGGMVTLRTPDPEEFLGADPLRVFTRLGYSGSNAGKALSVGAAAASGDWSSLVLLGQRSGHARDNNGALGTAPNPADSASRSGLLKFVREDSGAGRWRLVMERSDHSAEVDVQSLVRGPGQYATTNLLLADDQLRRERVSLDAGFTNVAGFDELRAMVFTQDSHTDQRTLQQRDADTRTRYPVRRDRRFDYLQRARGLELLGSRRHEWAGSSHWHVFGLEYARTRHLETRFGSETNLNTGTSTNVVIGERLPVRDFPPSTVDELGLFWQDEISFGDGRWSLIPGLRWDSYEIDARPDALYLEDNQDTPVVDLDETRATAKLGLRRALGEHSSLFAQYAQGFRAPPFSDLNIGLNIAAFNYIALPNPDLESETSHGLEFGWRLESSGHTQQLAVFENRYRNLIESRVNIGPDPETGALRFQSLNRNRARIRGVEWTSRIALDRLTPALENFSLRSSLAWTEGRDSERDEALNSVEPARAILGIRYDEPARNWGAEFMLTGVSGKDAVDESNGALFKPHGYARADLFGWWTPHPALRLNLGLINLTDRNYWEWSSVRGLPTSDPSLGLYAASGRAINASLTFEFR